MERIVITRPDNTTTPIVPHNTGAGITSAKQTWELLGNDVVNISVVSPAKLTYEIGDKLEAFGRNYSLNQLPKVKKIGSHSFQYDLDFEGIQYDLLRATYDLTIDTTSNELQDVQADTLTGDLERFATVLIANANRVFPTVWALGDCPETVGDKTLSFNEGDNCLSVLQNLCNEFQVEFEIVQALGVNTINFKKNVGSIFPYTFKFGKGKGLYQLDRQNVDSSNIVTRLKVYGSTKNITTKYRANRLCLPGKTKGGSYIQQTTPANTYGIYEATKYFDDIEPTFDGTITAIDVGDVLKFTDTSMFNLNEKEADGITTKYLLPGLSAKIHFNSGNLAGYEFDIKSYDHATHTFTINKITDDRGDVFPNAASVAFKFSVGDKYKILDVALPDSYISDAENDLLGAGNEYYSQNSQPKVQYGLSVTRDYLKSLVGVDSSLNIFKPGDYIPVQDTDIDVDKSVRIKSLVRNLLDDLDYQLTIADTVTTSIITRIISDQIEVNKIIQINNLTDFARARNNWRNTQEMMNLVFDPDGDYYTEKIKPASIETLYLAVGAKAQSYSLNGVIIEPNYGGNPNSLHISAGQLIHYDLEIKGVGYVWEMSAETFTDLDPDKYYYVFAKISQNLLLGTWVISETPLLIDNTSLYWTIGLGLLFKVQDGFRNFEFTKGMTYIVGDTIKSGKIQSIDGQNYFDLTGGKFNLGNASSGIDWDVTAANKLTIRGGVVANAGGIEEPLGVYRGAYDPDAVYYKGDTLTYNGSLWRVISTTPITGITPEEGSSYALQIQRGSTGLGTNIRIIYRKNDDPDNPPDLDVDDPDPVDWSLQMPQIDTQWLLGTEAGDFIVGNDGDQYLTTVDGEYIWASTEVLNEDNEFDHWSPPTRITGRNGIPTEYTEYRFQKNGSPINPPSINKTDPDPALWTIQMPVLADAEYMWMIKANKLPTGFLVSAWSDPVRVNGVDANITNQGDPGPFMMFRGGFDVTKQYVGNSARIEAVSYNGSYYVTRIDAGNIPISTLPTDADYWNSFVGEFESIATGLLLAELAYIKNLGVNWLRTNDSGSRIELKGVNEGSPGPDDNTLIFYDANGDEILRIDDDIDFAVGNAGEFQTKAGMRVYFPATGRTAYITGNGMFSNAGGVQFLSSVFGVKTNASVVGLLFDRNDDNAGISAAVVGLDGTSTGNSESWGGYFNSLKVTGKMNVGGVAIDSLDLAAQVINAAGTYSATKSIITTYHSSGTATINLPTGADLDKLNVIILKRMNSGGSVTISGNGNTIIQANNAAVSSFSNIKARYTNILFFDDSYWHLVGII